MTEGTRPIWAGTGLSGGIQREITGNEAGYGERYTENYGHIPRPKAQSAPGKVQWSGSIGIWERDTSAVSG